MLNEIPQISKSGTLAEPLVSSLLLVHTIMGI